MPVHSDDTLSAHMKAGLVTPLVDILLAQPLWDRGEAWNVVDGDVPPGSFYAARGPEEWTLKRLSEGPQPEMAPRQPFRIDRIKHEGVTPGFFATDATGRQYVVKLDDPRYPELGSSAAVIATHIFHVLGYHVPPTFPLTLEGTGDAEFDGRRAAATLLITDARGQFRYEWFRYRRELRALRMVAAWLNEVDRGPHNNMVVMENGAAKCYQIDFNSSLGSWQGRPKAPWRGWQPAGDVVTILVQVLTFGLVSPGYDPRQPVISPAVGRFDANYDPMKWRSQTPNAAFDQMTAADREWIARKIAKLGRPELEAVVSAAGLSRERDRRYIVDTLLARQAKILALAGLMPGGNSEFKIQNSKVRHRPGHDSYSVHRARVESWRSRADAR